MTKQELGVLSEVANDIKWLKKSIEENAQFFAKQQEQIIEHLATLNKQVTKNRIRSSINRYGIAALFAVTGIIITILLHLMGVY